MSERKVVSYKVVSLLSADAYKVIDEYLSEGYELYGFPTPCQLSVIQAIVKYSDNSLAERRIVDYKRLADHGKVSTSGSYDKYGPIDLDSCVKEHLKDGWHLHGHTFSNEGTCYQAMVKYED